MGDLGTFWSFSILGTSGLGDLEPQGLLASGIFLLLFHQPLATWSSEGFRGNVSWDIYPPQRLSQHTWAPLIPMEGPLILGDLSNPVDNKLIERRVKTIKQKTLCSLLLLCYPKFQTEKTTAYLSVGFVTLYTKPPRFLSFSTGEGYKRFSQ